METVLMMVGRLSMQIEMVDREIAQIRARRASCCDVRTERRLDRQIEAMNKFRSDAISQREEILQRYVDTEVER